MTDRDQIQMKIEQVQRDEITPQTAANTLKDWFDKDLADERDYAESAEEDIQERKAKLVHASFAIGVPDLFSDDMRWFWDGSYY